MRTQSATITITRAVTVAAGAFAPGHLGELTQYLPFELVDDILTQTKTAQRRLRDLPSRVGCTSCWRWGCTRGWATGGCGPS